MILFVVLFLSGGCISETSGGDSDLSETGDLSEIADDWGEDKAEEFAPTACFPDPAVGFVEVRLTDLAMATWVSTSAEEETDLSAGVLADRVKALIVDHDCPYSPYILDSENVQPSTHGSLERIFISGGDPFAGGLFDRRNGDVVLAWAGDWLSTSERCFPEDPLSFPAPVVDGHAEDPEAIFCEYDPCDEEAVTGLVDRLNDYGASWASLGGGTWTDRTFDELWEAVSRTAFAHAFAACGTYDVFLQPLGPGGGSYSNDVQLIKLLFVFVGRADESIL